MLQLVLIKLLTSCYGTDYVSKRKTKLQVRFTFFFKV